MSERKDLLKFFHEDNLKDGAPVNDNDLDPDQRSEFELLELIWSESSDLSDIEDFDAGKVWAKMETATVPQTVVETPVIEKAPEVKQTARVVPIRRYIAAAAAVGLLFIVGSRVLMQDSAVPVYKTFQTSEEARQYAFNTMLPIAEDILVRAQSDDFENTVYQMAGQRFDGETNVLVERIAAEALGKRRYRDNLEAFRNIDGNNYYPQIFIPDYENYQSKPGDPVIVFYLTDDPGRDGTYSYVGYKVEDGKLVEHAMINEQSLKNERVWVFSINENVDNFGQVNIPDFGAVQVNNGTGGRIDRIAVYDAKESWAGGSSELRIRGVMESWNGLDASGEVAGRQTIVSTTHPMGIRVKNLTRAELGSELEIDYPLHDAWDQQEFLNGEVQLAFVLFEADVWPNSVNQASYKLANGEPRMFTYSSAQEPYDVAQIFAASSPEGWRSPVFPSGIPDSQLISTFSQQNQSIRYNTETY